jgi:hypothetical protein
MASMQCIKPEEKACDQEQERMVHVQTEQSLSHEKVDSVTQCNCQTNGPGSQAQVDQKKNHEKSEKKMKDKKGKKEKEKEKKEKKGKKENDKKKEKSGDKKK